MLQVQGSPALSEELGLEIRVPWGTELDDLTDIDMAKLAGNSVHPMVAGHLTLWTPAAIYPGKRTQIEVIIQTNSTQLITFRKGSTFRPV